MTSSSTNGVAAIELVTNLGEKERLPCSLTYPPEMGMSSPEVEGQEQVWTEHMVKWQRKTIEVTRSHS